MPTTNTEIIVVETDKKMNLRFPDANTALAVAQAISGNPDVTQLPLDGRLTIADGRTIYYNIHAINGDGSLFRHDGVTFDADGNPVYAKVPGYHVIGWWHCEGNTLPTALSSYLVDEDFGIVWG